MMLAGGLMAVEAPARGLGRAPRGPAASGFGLGFRLLRRLKCLPNELLTT